MTTDPHKLAASLSAAQKRVLTKIVDKGNNPYGWTAEELGVSGATLTALTRKGLLMSGRIYGSRVTSYRFEAHATAVYEAVRAVLIEEAAQ